MPSPITCLWRRAFQMSLHIVVTFCSLPFVLAANLVPFMLSHSKTIDANVILMTLAAQEAIVQFTSRVQSIKVCIFFTLMVSLIVINILAIGGRRSALAAGVAVYAYWLAKHVDLEHTTRLASLTITKLM